MLRNRLLILGCALLFGLQQFSIVHAQYINSDLDIDPPVIDHEALENGVAGAVELFSALVIDDKGIEYVDLYYRAGANSEYARAAMKSAAGVDKFSVTVPTEPGQVRIEYYIEAADTGGNRVLKGFPFFPLVRNLDVPATVTTTTATTGSGQSKLLYVLLGALAVGLLASASSSGTDPGPDPGNQVPLTINISAPTNR